MLQICSMINSGKRKPFGVPMPQQAVLFAPDPEAPDVPDTLPALIRRLARILASLHGGAGSRQLFSYVSLDAWAPKDHPHRLIRVIVDGVLTELSGEVDRLYAATGRPSIPPEKLLRAASSSLLHDPLRTPADGAAGLQASVPLVRRVVG